MTSEETGIGGQSADAGRTTGPPPDEIDRSYAVDSTRAVSVRGPQVADSAASERPGDPTAEPHVVSSSERPPATNGLGSRDTKAPSIRGIEDLFRFAYAQGGGKRLSIPAQSLHLMVREAEAEPLRPDPIHKLLAELSADDPGLAVPVRMLTAVEAASPPYPLTKRLLEYIRIVLRRHDAMRRAEVLLVLDEESGDLESALAAVSETIRGLPDDRFAGPAKGDQRSKLQVNATISLALWFSMRKKRHAIEFADVLDRYVWRPELKRSDLRHPMSVLAESRTPEVLGWVAREYGRRIDDVSRRLHEAERFAEGTRAREAELAGRAREREARLADQLEQQRQVTEALTAEVARLEDTIRGLQTALADQQRQRSVEKTHHADDYKGLRARVMRSLDKQSELLRSGLHALRNERLSVADEYVERSLDAIDRERTRLREEEE